MANLHIPNIFVPGTPALASEVNANFQAVAEVLNGNIDAQNLKDRGIPSGKLADGAINTQKLANSAVTGSKIANDSIDTAHIKSAAVTASKLADGSVGTGKLANAAVTSDKLANGSVSTDKIQDGAVTNAKLASATSSKTANTLAMRDSNGRLRVDTPSHNDDAANKGYVDDAVAGTFDVTVPGIASGHSITGPGYAVFQRYPVTVPSGHQLVLKRVRFQTTATSNRVRIAGATGTWTSNASSGDVSPGTVLAGSGTNNVTFSFGTTAEGTVIVGMSTPTGGGAGASNILATLAIEPV